MTIRRNPNNESKKKIVSESQSKSRMLKYLQTQDIRTRGEELMRLLGTILSTGRQNQHLLRQSILMNRYRRVSMPEIGRNLILTQLLLLPCSRVWAVFVARKIKKMQPDRNERGQ